MSNATDPDKGAEAFPLSLVTAPVFADLAFAANNGIVSATNKISAMKYLEGKMSIQGSVPDIFALTPAGYKAAQPGQQAIATGLTYATIAGGAGTLVLLATPASFLVGPLMIASLFGAPTFSDPRVCSMIICNGLNGTLTRKDVYFDCGHETHYPAIVDPTGVDPPAGAHVIPGWTTLPTTKPPTLVTGIGVYRFENSRALGLGFYGTGGAVSFTSTDPRTNGKEMAVSWLVPATGKVGYAPTSDLSQYSSLGDFYNKTADQRTVNVREVGDYYDIACAMGVRDSDSNDLVMTVCVQHGKK